MSLPAGWKLEGEDQDPTLPAGWKLAPEPIGSFRGALNSARRGARQAGQSVDAASTLMAASMAAGATREPDVVAREQAEDPAPDPKNFEPGGSGIGGARGYAIARQKWEDRQARRQERLEGAKKFSEGVRRDVVPQLVGAIARRQGEIADIPQTEGKEQFDQAQGLGQTLGAIARHPIDTVAGVAAESLPASLPSLALGALGSAAGPGGTAAGAGAGSLMAEVSSTILSELQAAGVDFNKPETVAAILNDPEKIAAIQTKAVARGVPVALVDAISAGIAGRFLRKPAASILGRVAQGAAEAGTQGALGGVGEIAGSVVAGDKIDPKAVISEIIGELGTGTGEIATGLVRDRALGDTGRTVAESKPTLDAQQEQLLAGRRMAQMFPTGTKELALPAGMERIETERGVFHYNPKLVDAEAIAVASERGRENDVLGLGPASKADVAATGERPLTITERDPAGTEVKAAATAPSLARQTAAVLEQTKTPGNTVAAEPLGQVVAGRTGKSFVDDMLDADARRALEKNDAEKRQAFERSQRQQELAGKRKLFDERVATARDTFADPKATFAQVQGAFEAVRYYAEDNSLGLTQDQRQTAGKAATALSQRLEQLRPAEDAARAAAAAEAQAKAEAEKEQARAARAAGKADFKAQAAAGIGADGSLDYTKLSEDRLAELAQGGDKKAEEALMRRADTAAADDIGDRHELGAVLRKIKLPSSDVELKGELAETIKEWMNPKQRMELLSGKPGSLDGTAEQLRADYGFSWIQTPADVIDAVQRHLRGEKVLSDRGPEPQMATKQPAAPAPVRQLTESQVNSQIAALRREFPSLTRDVDLKTGLVEAELRKAGYRGKVPAEVQAAIYQLEAEKRLLVIATQAAREGQAPALLLHELAHPFFDALPAETRAVLRDLHAHEMATKTGPLFDEQGNLKTDLAVRPEDFTADRLRADPDLPVKEWFAERARALNEGWLNGRIPQDHSLIRALWQRMLATLREVFARVRGLDPDGDLFTKTFRQWLDSGAKADVNGPALAYAEKARTEFAAKKKPSSEEVDKIVAEATKVQSVPGRRERLIEEYKRGNQMQREGYKTGNQSAEDEGATMLLRASKLLDEEFPGWRQYHEEKASQPAAGQEMASTEEGSGVTGEQSPFEPAAGAGEEMPVRPGMFNQVYGQGGHQSPAWERSWTKAKAIIAGIKGSIPELPTFPAAWWNKSDAFLKSRGAGFYNRIKEGFRVLRSGTDYVQRTAEEKVSRVIRPLIEAGGKFDANDYAKLRARQEQARRLRADGKPVPRGVSAEIAALNSKLESSPYVLFNRLALALDLNWRQQNLKDSEGNPIRLPANVNPAEVQAELRRLSDRIAVSPHAELIQTALREHMALVKQAADELKDRDLLAAEHLENPYYFPHLTLEVNEGDKMKQRELRPTKIKPGTEADFRGYLIDPVGSSKAIETDYLRSMYYHLVQLGAHNFKADVVRDFFRPYDVKSEAEAKAKELSKQRGVPVSWEQAFHEVYEPQGYVLYGNDSRDAYPSITVNRDQLARRMGVMLTSEDLHTQLKRLGLQGIKLLPEDLQETLETGARETWIVPARVAEALRGIADRENKPSGAIDTAMKHALGAWKAWKLFMPWNHVRYEYGNFVADMEKLISADPRTFRMMGPAAKEVRDFWKGGVPSDDLRAALKEGVINAITAQEMEQLGRLPAFDAFQTTMEKAWTTFKRRSSSALFQPVSNLVGMGDFSSVELSAYREAVFRYAKFKSDLEAIRNGSRPSYGGAYWKDIDAMDDSAKGAGDKAVRQAAAISKATFGNYGDLSVLGTQLRDKLIPFYSWMEVNFKYHANLLRNLRDMVTAGELSQAEAMKRGSRAAATFAAGFTARAAGGIVLRLAIPYVAASLWNSSGDRDELEKLLSDEDRRRFHIIIGETDDGNTTLKDGRKIEVVYGNTAFMDVAKWFGGPAFMQQAGAWLNGKTDFPTAFSAWRDRLVPDFINNTVGSAGPFLKIPYTLGSGKNPFPDVLDQRTVPAYDMRRVVIGQVTDDFTADMIERTVNKDYYAGRDLGTWAKQLILQVRQRDPNSWAFYEIKDKAAAFLEQQTGQHRDNNYDAPDQQVLRNFRRAIYRGDLEKATQFYVRLLDYGYTAERFAASIRAQDPLASLPKTNGLRQKFVDSLTPFDREQLERAYEFYGRINGGRGRERAMFPSELTGQRGLENFRQQPRTDRLEQMMQKSGGMTAEERARQAQRDQSRSLIRTR